MLISCFSLNLIVIYLILSLIMIITFKFVFNTTFTTEKIKSLPLGRYIPIILNKLIISWQKSSIIWVYFLLFFILLFTSVNTYALYMCILIMK